MPFPFELDTLAVVGITITAAFVGGQVFRRLGIPQVVGFIITGVLLGPSLLNIIPPGLDEGLGFVSEIALGLIGFEMGGHLQFDELRQMGRSIVLIVLFEALGAFALVTLGVHWLTGSIHTALIFGSLSAATAPAATVDVLAEYNARGPLTTTLLTVVGLDDALALLLFSLSAALVEHAFVGTSPLSIWRLLELPLLEIGGSLVLGIGFGFLLSFVMRWFHLLPRIVDIMVIPVGTIFICTGLARAFDFSPILTNMALGLIVTNRDAGHGKYIRTTIEQAGPVIYVLFFALAGARLNVRHLSAMGLLGVIYVLLRGTGKYIGAWSGGRLGQAKPVVHNNLGLALLSQAGVAIGLALESQRRFSELGSEGAALGNLVLTVITATTLVVQIIGPVMVKFAITRAGEVGQAHDTMFAE